MRYHSKCHLFLATLWLLVPKLHTAKSKSERKFILVFHGLILEKVGIVEIFLHFNPICPWMLEGHKDSETQKENIKH